MKVYLVFFPPAGGVAEREEMLSNTVGRRKVFKCLPLFAKCGTEESLECGR